MTSRNLVILNGAFAMMLAIFFATLTSFVALASEADDTDLANSGLSDEMQAGDH